MLTRSNLFAYSRLVHACQTWAFVVDAARADDHKVLYDRRSLSALLQDAGFTVQLLEWFDEDGHFHHENWEAADGLVVRSTGYDPRNRVNPIQYTSLIVDAIKL